VRFAFTASSLLHRFIAVVGVALVLALNLLAVWPEIHALIHGDELAPPTSNHGAGAVPHLASASGLHCDEDDCIVVKFAHGHGGLAVAPVFHSATALVLAATTSSFVEPLASPSAFLLPPGCGPPAV